MTSARLFSVTPGEELVEALARAVSGAEGWVQASGFVEAAEVRVAGEGADPVRALRGRWALCSLTGPAGGPYGVTLSRATESGLEVAGGQLVRAVSAGVTAAIVGSTTIAASPPVAKEPPKAPAAPKVPPAASPAAQPTASAWAAHALQAARARRIPIDEQDDPVLPGPGDLVQHFAFGLCEVLMAEDDRLKIRDVQGQGRIREIRLEMLRIQGPQDRDGKKLFRLERRM
jgi:hypothetical protein